MKRDFFLGSKKVFPYTIVFFLGIVWGSTFSLARIATESGLHPIGLTFWQALGGAIVLFILCCLRRNWGTFDTAQFWRFIIIGFLGTAVPSSLYFYTAPHVPAGILAITVTLVPMLTYAAGLFMGFDTFSRLRVLGIFLGFFAMLLLVVPETSLPEKSMVSWLLIALIAPLFYTTENVFIERYIPPGTDMLALLMGGMFAAAIMVLPVVWMENAFVPIVPPFSDAELALIAMMIISAIAYFLFLYLITLSGAVFASMSAYIITLSGVFWGMWIFNEQHSIWVWGALIILMTGMALVTPRDKSSEVALAAAD